MINQSKPMNRSQEKTNTQREGRSRKNHTPTAEKKAKQLNSLRIQNRYTATTIMIQNTIHKQTELKSSNRKIKKKFGNGKLRSISTST